jgi:citrate lyase beta subunit
MSIPPKYAGIRSILESPIMDDHKWEKIPGIPADAIFVDLEDSLPPDRKEEGRLRAVEYLAKPEYFDGRVTIARPNAMSTPWGREDIQALAQAGVACVALPKLKTAEDVLEIQELFRADGADPDIFAIIETAQSIFESSRIAAVDKVMALMFGAGDLSVDSGIPLVGADRDLNPAIVPAKVQAVLAGAAFGCLTTDIAFFPDIRDLTEVRRRYLQVRALGFTTGVTFYPPHVEIINEIFGVSPAEVEEAEAVIDAYEAARSAGNPAVTLESGRVLLIHDYEKALHVRARAGAIRGAAI